MINVEILSIMITILMGFTGTFGFYQWKQRKTRRRLRKALKAELTAMAPRIHPWAQTNLTNQTDDFMILTTDPIISTVYNQNTDQIGILSDEEVEKITNLYSLGERLRERQGNLQTKNDVGINGPMLINDLTDFNNQLIDAINLLDNKTNTKSNIDIEKLEYNLKDRKEKKKEETEKAT